MFPEVDRGNEGIEVPARAVSVGAWDVVDAASAVLSTDVAEIASIDAATTDAAVATSTKLRFIFMSATNGRRILRAWMDSLSKTLG